MILKNDSVYFRRRLLAWNEKVNNRPMPWKGETDPYKIWLSEIILQQTRVEQGWDYYNRFVKAYPTIEKLAKAPEQKVFKLWEGLGYYTRCKNLLVTAKFISKEKKAKFPNNYIDILKLKGVGPYTAAAIASFAFNLPYAVVDGNVFRVLSRFFGIDTPIDNGTGKKMFTALAEELLDKKRAGIYNQALMDFGAVVCKPKSPLCYTCPLKTKCWALAHDKIDKLPVKAGKITKRKRWFYYFVIEHKGKFLVKKRGPKDIWENLYEFTLLETGNSVTVEFLKKAEIIKNLAAKSKFEIKHVSKQYKQQLSHQTIQGRFIRVSFKNSFQQKDYKAVTYKELTKLPFPKVITSYLAENDPLHLKDKNVSLNLLKHNTRPQ